MGNGFIGDADADPGGHRQLGGHTVAQHRHHERKGQVSAGNDARCGCQCGHGHGQSEAPGAQDTADETPKAGLDERFETGLELQLQPGEPDAQSGEHAVEMACIDDGRGAQRQRNGRSSIRCKRNRGNDQRNQQGHAEIAQRHALPAMAEMRRQHHLALDQREHEAENHRGRHNRHDFPDGTDAEQQRSKRCHRGQHPECDRDQHVLRALNSAGELPGAPPMGDIDALAHHHGIVH